ncbi:MAG: hypothetical protein KC586_06730 [Myxococcales bacterium]|nr:hypothetical protein [Myxococcales bacterium]
MQFDEACRVLDVPEGDLDSAGLRRAYLRAVRQHPPERDPEGFARVRAAFEQLEARVLAKDSPDTPSEPPSRAPLQTLDDSAPDDLHATLRALAARPAPERAKALEALVLTHPDERALHGLRVTTHLECDDVAWALVAARELDRLGDPNALLHLARLHPAELPPSDRDRVAKHEPFTLARALVPTDPDDATRLGLRALAVDAPAPDPLVVIDLALAVALHGRGDLAASLLGAFRTYTKVHGEPAPRVELALRLFSLALYVPEPLPPEGRRALLRGTAELARLADPDAIDLFTIEHPAEALKVRRALQKHAPELDRAVGEHFVRGAVAKRRSPPQWTWLLLLATCAVPRLLRTGTELSSAVAREIDDAFYDDSYESYAPGDFVDEPYEPPPPPAVIPDVAAWSTATRRGLVVRGCEKGGVPGCDQAQLLANALESGQSCEVVTEASLRFHELLPGALDPALEQAVDREVDALCARERGL